MTDTHRLGREEQKPGNGSQSTDKGTFCCHGDESRWPLGKAAVGEGQGKGDMGKEPVHKGRQPSSA